MKPINFSAPLALAALLLQACGTGSNMSATPATKDGIRSVPTAQLRQMRLREHIDAIAGATSLNARNEFVVENVIGDAADGEPTPRIDVTESRFNSVHEVWVTITTDKSAEMRSYIAENTKDGMTLYIKGPSPDVGVEDSNWRMTRNRSLIDDRLNSMPTRVMPGFLPDPDALEPAFGPPERVEIDGIACDKHAAPGDRLPADVTAGVRAMFSRVDALTFTVALCSDGFLRELNINATGAGTTDADKPASVDIRLSFSGFNAAAVIAPPPVFQPLDESFMNIARDPDPTPEHIVPPPDTPEAANTPDGAPLTDMNDGSYGTSEPLVGIVTDLIPVKVDPKSGELNYMSSAPLDALFGYYQTHYGAKGLKERTVVTSRFENGFSIVFDGLPEGAALVVQATRVDAKNVNVNISRRME